METYIIGIIGAVTIILAWLVNLYKTLRQQGHSIDPLFTGIYIIASATLTYYSFLIADSIFSILNGIATLLAVCEFAAYWYFRK